MTITEDDLKRLDDRYVTKEDCEARNDKTQEDIAGMRTELSAMCAKQTVTNKILIIIATAIISGIVGLAVSKIFGG